MGGDEGVLGWMREGGELGGLCLEIVDARMRSFSLNWRNEGIYVWNLNIGMLWYGIDCIGCVASFGIIIMGI